MNQPETVILCRMIKSLCPGQAFDAYTPDAWALVLDDIPYADAQAAVRTIYREYGSDAEWNRKIEADDIIRQVRREANKRIEEAEADLIPPADMTVAQYQQWLKDARKRLVAGNTAEQINGDLGQLRYRDPRRLEGVA